jgi:G3E family GTPase
MSKKPELLFIGGFLGAGKTTAIKELAKIFAERGLTAAAITNDQAEGLVDTFFLSGSGIHAEEVAGSCFCCNFPGLSESITHSIETVDPDVILAEPVGSCTDIVATVIRPMRALMGEKVNVQAYSVLVEPDRWAELADDGAEVPWSMKFLFDKQLQEADFIVITKSDTLNEDQQGHIGEQVSKRFPESSVLEISSREGTNLNEWLELIQSTAPKERWLKEIDYDKYAEAEAEMGWLNSHMSIRFPQSVDGKSEVFRIAETLTQGVGERQGKIGHLKLLAVGETGSIKAGLTHLGGTAGLDGTFTGPLSELQVTINMRATVSPGDLAAIVTNLTATLEGDGQTQTDVAYLNTFRPGAPDPTYRYES